MAAGVGASLALGNPLKVYQRRFYAKSGNPTAAAPYATEETAAADLQTAIDAVTQDGAEVIALRGVYEITSNILVKARQITLRGETGNPEDVIVRNTTTAKWLPSEWDERKSKGEGRCLVLDAGPASRVESMTFENGKGLYAVDIGCGLYLGDWNNRGVWPAAGKGGVVSNCVVRNCSSGSNKYGITPGIFANGPYLITHTVVTNCTSGSGNSDGGRFCGVGLDIGGGARAEHCLIAGNRDSFYKEIKSEWPAYGRGIVGGVMVRDNSSIRFSTVAGNRGTMIGGVNVNGSQARVENCIILNNTIEGDILACAVTTNRFACWGIMTWDTTKDLISGTTKLGEGNIAKLAADEIASVAEHPEKVDAAFVNCITDLEVAGLTGLLSSGEEVFRNAANRDYRLRGGSPALDRILPEDAGTMPEKDLLGNPRLHGARYDLGCYECISTGLMMLFR